MINVALLGNPNVGKTTVFNLLTGSDQYVGNWPGVTIDKKEGFLDKDIKIIDLPGIYAMDTFSNEEKVAKNFLEKGNVDVILNVLDASNIVRNLYLTTQLMKFNKPIILLLNMIDVAESKGIDIDVEKLSNELNIPVIPIVAKKKSGVDKISTAIRKEKDKKVKYTKDFGSETETYTHLEELISRCTKHNSSNKKSISDRIDDIVLNPILAYPIFIAALLLLFKFTFDWIGGPLQDALTVIIENYISQPLDNLLANSSPWFRSLIINGIVGGVGGTLPFFPLIFTLFLGISIFEDSGYMSRTAFLMDRTMRKVGLSGKAFIPMIMGLGCSSPAIMATRTLESEKDRKITALVAPLMTCGARLPIYALFTAVFFPKNAAIITTSLYLIGIVFAILIALLLNRTRYKGHSEPFLLELPEYKLPTLHSLFKNTWNKSKDFLQRVVTVMFAMSVVLWVLSSFNFNGFTENINNSFLAYLGKLVEPLFVPLGFKDWRASVAILSGLGAKEVVVNTLNVLFGNLRVTLPTAFTPVSAYAFLVFSSLYSPCFAALATMRREYGNKMMIVSFVYQFVLAWLAAFVANIIGTIIFSTELNSVTAIEFLVSGVIFLTAAIIIYRKLTHKSSGSCFGGCSGCSGCPSGQVSKPKFDITNYKK